MKRRAIATLVSNSRQTSVQMGYSGFSEWRVSFNSLKAKLVVVYRSPYSEAHPITPRVFFEEFGSYLETIILSPESLILTGDYNFHVDVEDDPDARPFLDLLASMGLKQHVNVPTHTR